MRLSRGKSRLHMAVIPRLDKVRMLPQVCALAALCIFAFLIRCVDLGKFGLWFDEANTILISRLDWAHIVEALRHDGNPPLYYLLMNLWMRCWGTSPATVEGLSLAIGVASIPVVWFIASRTVDRQTGWITAGLLVMAPFHVFYSQQARMYTLLPLAYLLSLWTLYEALQETADKKWWAAYVSATVVAIYTHNFALLLFPAQLTYMVCCARRREIWLWWGASLAAVGLCYLPWLPGLAGQMANLGVYQWLGEQLAALSLNAWDQVWRSLRLLMVGIGAPPTYGLSAQFHSNNLCVVTHLAAWLFAGHSIWKERKAFKYHSWCFLLVLSIVVPYACALVYSAVRQPILTIGRVDSMFFLPLLILTVFGIRFIRLGALKFLLSVILLIGSLTGLDLQRQHPYSLKVGEFRLNQYLLNRVRDNDLVICPLFSHVSFGYEVWRRALSVTVLAFPYDVPVIDEKCSTNEDPRCRTERILQQAELMPTRVASMLSAGQRVWFLEPYPIHQDIVYGYHPRLLEGMQRVLREISDPRIPCLGPVTGSVYMRVRVFELS